MFHSKSHAWSHVALEIYKCLKPLPNLAFHFWTTITNSMFDFFKARLHFIGFTSVLHSFLEFLEFIFMRSWFTQGPQSKNFLCHSLSLPLKALFFKDFIHLLLERGEGSEKETERNINVWLHVVRPLLGTWPATQACALTGASNRQPLGSQASAQSTEPHQPGPRHFPIYQHLTHWSSLSIF